MFSLLLNILLFISIFVYIDTVYPCFSHIKVIELVKNGFKYLILVLQSTIKSYIDLMRNIKHKTNDSFELDKTEANSSTNLKQDNNKIK